MGKASPKVASLSMVTKSRLESNQGIESSCTEAPVNSKEKLSTHYLPSVNKYDWSTCKFKAKNAHALFNLSQQVWLVERNFQFWTHHYCTLLHWRLQRKHYITYNASIAKPCEKTWSAHSKLTQGQFPLPCKHENCFSISKDSEKSSWW